MPWFNKQYVRSLEEEKSRLLKENLGLRSHIDQLVERLLRKNGIPAIELPPEPSKEAMDKMLQSTNIFDDVEESSHSTPYDIVDNRKEKFDEFVS